ncbi:MAG: DUF6390 family protein [Sporichthyaceae bacterium]
MPGSAGEAAFARYAFPPNDLGHCGPPGADVLLAAGAGAATVARLDLRERAAGFDGAWPYLRLLAATAGTDELDAEVVSAYWLGGPLLDGVDADAFEDTVRRDFGGQPGVLDRLAAEPGGWATGPNHAFHVFVVYPWVGLLGAGREVPVTVLESCRVRWGTVQSVEDGTATVVGRPLTWSDGRLALGPETPEVARWSRDAHDFVSGLRPGDLVALHWDWVCDRLTPERLAELEAVTRRQLASTNRWLAGRSAAAPG